MKGKGFGLTGKPFWLGAVVVWSMSAGGAWADGTAWDALSADQQGVLQSYQEQWAALPENTQQVLLRWAALPESERVRIKSRHKQWNALSAQRQAKILRKLERYKRMPLEKRLKIKAWRDWVKTLPEHEQQSLHEKWPDMGSGERKEYIQQLEDKYGKH